MKQVKLLECAYGKKLEAVDNDAGQFITTHNKLLNVISQIGISYTIDFVVNVPERPDFVCICTMTDPRNSRSVTAVGEVTSKNTYNDFDRLHPAYTASIRAFDRAAIQILEIKESLYSYSEISKEMFFGKANPNKMKNQKAAQNPRPEEKQDKDKPVDNKNVSSGTNRPCMPIELGETILIGSLKGRKYDEVKDTTAMTGFIQMLKQTPEAEYGTAEENAQAKFFRKLS